MASYKIGSKGDEVVRIQKRLAAEGYYRGPFDGDFGGGTMAAVMAYQKGKGLSADGVVGSKTWNVLFEEVIPSPAGGSKPIDYKCLALTGAFETNKGIPDCFSGLSGDFDGQGISFGVLQWNFGQDSLQPLLNAMIDGYPDIMRSIFLTNYEVLGQALRADKEDLMAFVRSIQHPVKHYLYEPWKGMFKSLGRTVEFQNIERRYARKLFEGARQLCSEYSLLSERAVALMFDIKVQNGSIKPVTKSQILADFNGLRADLSQEDQEIEKMRIIANRRADAADPRWAEDVRARKLCCANGGGVVHGINYDLETQFGITLKRFNGEG